MKMKKKLLGVALAGTMLASLSTGTALAGPPASAGDGGMPDGIACQQAGIGTLQALDLLSAVAKGGIEVVDVGVVPFKDVLALHRSNPELFQTGGVSVLVPGLGEVPATWCDGI